MNGTIPNSLRAAGLFAALALAIACSDVSGLGGREPVALTLAMPSTSAAPGLSLRIVAGNGHTLDLQNADLGFRDMRLDGENVDGDGDSDSEAGDSDADAGDSDDIEEDSENDADSDDASFRTGPVTIALPLDGGAVTLLNQSVPVGTYDELEGKVDFLRLRGTYDGAPFDVTFDVNRHLEIAISPPLVVSNGDDNQNVTVVLDVMPCLTNPDGSPIDPRALQTDETLRQQVRACLKATFRAFEDRDRDGDEQDSDSDNS